jgi:hypothetical protein
MYIPWLVKFCGESRSCFLGWTLFSYYNFENFHHGFFLCLASQFALFNYVIGFNDGRVGGRNVCRALFFEKSNSRRSLCFLLDSVALERSNSACLGN